MINDVTFPDKIFKSIKKMGDHPTQINKTCLLGDFVCAFYLKMQVINEFFYIFFKTHRKFMIFTKST